MKKIYFLILISFTLCCFRFPAGAFNLSISEPIVEREVHSGETVTGTLNLTNPSEKEARVSVYPGDFIYLSPFEGEKEFLPVGTSEFSCALWISFAPGEFSLLPYQTRGVDYTIRVPDDIQGGYAAILFFETSLGAMKDAVGSYVKVLGRVGVLFFINAVGSRKQASISGIKAQGSRILGTLSNSGEVFIRIQGTYYVIDSQGMAVERGEMPIKYLFPGDKANFDVEFLNSNLVGSYTLVCTFDLRNGDVAVKEVNFTRDSSGIIVIEVVKD